MVYVSSILTLSLKKLEIMIVTCKKCKKDLTYNAVQMLYNKHILDGYKCYDSSGKEIKFKVIEICKCK